MYLKIAILSNLTFTNIKSKMCIFFSYDLILDSIDGVNLG